MYHGLSPLSTHLTSLVRLLADEVDALYLSLDCAMDVYMEGAGKVHSSTLSCMKTKLYINVDTNLIVANM